MDMVKVGLFCDREDWITGTAARAIAARLPEMGPFDLCVSSQETMYAHPLKETSSLRKCDLLHWVSPYGLHHFSTLFPFHPQICNIHHCLDQDRHWPERYRGAKIVTMSQKSEDDLIERGFADVQIVHYGIDAHLFHPLTRSESRSKLALVGVSYPLIGFFGKGSSNSQDRKGTASFIRALELVNVGRQVGVLLSGDGWGALKQELGQRGIPVFHRRVQRIQEMHWLYGAIDLYLCTSRVEGGPVTVLEAMACERPVITTPVGHVPELVQHGENGMIVAIDDSEATADAVRTVLDHPSLARRLGEAGRKTVLSGWTWESALRPLAEIYASAANSSQRIGSNRLRFAKSLLLLLARSLKYHLGAG